MRVKNNTKSREKDKQIIPFQNPKGVCFAQKYYKILLEYIFIIKFYCKFNVL